MTTAHKIAASFTLSFVIILIAFVLSIVSPAFSATMYKDENSAANINLPGLTEDRYAGESRVNIVTIIESIIPAMLPPTSGQCGEDSGVDC